MTQGPRTAPPDGFSKRSVLDVRPCREQGSVDLALQGRAQERDRLGFLVRLTVKVVQSHAAEAKWRDFKTAFSEFRFCIHPSFKFLSKVSEELADGLFA